MSDSQPGQHARKTLVVFHAHPDDEALLTAGTMARAAGQGHRVVWVIATDGGLATTHVSLAAGVGLERLRRDEAAEAADILGVSRLVHLGYADSGAGALVPTDPPGRVRLAKASQGDVARHLAMVLTRERAETLVTDDAGGGYGHRDHVMAHRVGAEAARIAGTPRLLQATMPFAYSPPHRITHCVDVGDYVPAKTAALRAHRSQSSPSMGGDRALARCLGLPRSVFGWIFGREWFIGVRPQGCLIARGPFAR